MAFAGKPLVHFDFSKAQNGVVPNLGTGDYRAKLEGACKINGSILKMDGITSRVTIQGSEDFDISQSYTFMMLYKRENLPGNDKSNRSMDTFFAKNNVFVLNQYNTHFYGNGMRNGKWSMSSMRYGYFPKDDLEWHHVAITVQYKLNWNNAEEWVKFTFYKDGVPCGSVKHDNTRFDKKSSPIEIGYNSAMGFPWNLGGQIADVRIYEGAISEADLQKIVLSQKLAKPGFKVEHILSAAEEKALKKAGLRPEFESAVRNLATMGEPRMDWRKVMANPEKYLHLIEGKDSNLVLASGEDYCSVCSWYDRKAGREILKNDNTFIDWTFENWTVNQNGQISNGKLQTILPCNKNVRSKLSQAPRRGSNGTWYFTIAYDCREPDFSAITEFQFANDRLEFRHRAKNHQKDQTIHSVRYPKIAVRQFTDEGEELVVPEGCGVRYPEPCKKKVWYGTTYPGFDASMQFCSYYDKKGGLYFAVLDPRARRKDIDFVASSGRLDGQFSWRVPYHVPGKPNQFDTECSCVLQLFRGDWYDAGLLYKKDVAEMKADWWIPVLPKTTSRKDIMENSLWINEVYTGVYPDELFEFQKYLGQTFYVGDIWQWWEKGKSCQLSPTMRTKPEFIDYIRTLKEHGISTTPYMDGRLWAERDRRGKDWMYGKLGHKLNIVSDGKPVREMYMPNPCDTLCAATQGYQDHFFEFIKTLSRQGLNGLYIDQLGSGFPPPCHVATHGHCYADWDTTYMNGYAKLLRRLRAYWASQHMEMVLSTEDAAEPFCGLLDIFQPYRWIYENQVPLFPLVYSGRIQFYGRHALSKGARFQTTAEQLLNSEQPGIFSVGELTAASNADLRKYAKRLAWTRRALLDFFNCGQMARPPVMLEKMPTVRRLWDNFGTKYVTKPQVQSAVWDYGTTRAVILINTESTAHSNVISFELPAENCEYEVLSCGKQKQCGIVSGRKANIAFTLPPQMLQIILVYPKDKKPTQLLNKIEDDFQKVHNTLTEQDPFMKLRLPDTATIDASTGSNLAECASVSGCWKNPRGFYRGDYLSNAILYPGIVDFGSAPKNNITVEVLSSARGKAKIYVDDLGTEHLLTEFLLPEEQGTKSYIKRKLKLNSPVSGRHKLIFVVPEQGFNAIRSWHVE